MVTIGAGIHSSPEEIFMRTKWIMNRKLLWQTLVLICKIHAKDFHHKHALLVSPYPMVVVLQLEKLSFICLIPPQIGWITTQIEDIYPHGTINRLPLQLPSCFPHIDILKVL